MINANDSLREHASSGNFYRYNFGLVITSGVKTLCEQFECWWYLDIVASYQRDLKNEEFQVWKLLKNEDDSAIVTCENGNGIILKRQRIQWTDFRATECTVWVEFATCLLPSEH